MLLMETFHMCEMESEHLANSAPNTILLLLMETLSPAKTHSKTYLAVELEFEVAVW